MRAVTTFFAALHFCGTSGVPSLPRGLSEPKARHGIITTTNASDSCRGPRGLPFEGVAPRVESCLLAMTGLPAYPSVTSRHVAHRGGGGESRGLVDGRAADPAGPLPKPMTVGLGPDSAAFARIQRARLPGVLFRGSFLARPPYPPPRFPSSSSVVHMN